MTTNIDYHARDRIKDLILRINILEQELKRHHHNGRHGCYTGLNKPGSCWENNHDRM